MLHKTSIKLYQFQGVQILQLSLTCAKFHALTLHDHLNACVLICSFTLKFKSLYINSLKVVGPLKVHYSNLNQGYKMSCRNI